jgi:hypothetical protein
MFKKTGKTTTLGVMKPEEKKNKEAETKPTNKTKPVKSEQQNK